MKSIKIEIPQDYQIDKENSIFEEIKFKLVEQKFEYVDLGLPSGTLWATCNVGADLSCDFGKHFTYEEACKYNLPKQWQFQELIEECEWNWNSKLKGYVISGPSWNSIFLPAAGNRIGSSFNGTGSSGLYWSRTLYVSNPHYAWRLYFNSRNISMSGTGRCYGQSVRPIKNKNVELY